MLPGSAHPSWRRQCLAAVALALGESVELEHDDGVIGQQRGLDAPAQAAATTGARSSGAEAI
jgi:hypothetical protein